MSCMGAQKMSPKIFPTFAICMIHSFVNTLERKILLKNKYASPEALNMAIAGCVFVYLTFLCMTMIHIVQLQSFATSQTIAVLIILDLPIAPRDCDTH